jgi:flagellar hook protein FlgE
MNKPVSRFYRKQLLPAHGDSKMRLESALFSSREGLFAHGQAIAVAGDNIANANTTGYKTSRAEFADLLAEGSDGRESTTISGVGNGVKVQEIRALHESGSIEFTGRQFDVSVDGNGFFMVGDPANPFYTRAGNFSLDSSGVLVNAEGMPVLGYAPGTTTLTTLNLQDLDIAGTPTSAATIFGNLDASVPVATPPAAGSTFQQIAQSASFVSSLTTVDSLGASHDVTVAYYKTGNNTWTVQGYIDGADVGGEAGTAVQVGQDLNLTFTDAGIIEEANRAGAVITGAPAYSNGAAAGNFTINFGSFSQFSSPSQIAGITQDGKSTGNISSYEVRADGTIEAVLDSGSRVAAGSLVIADFPNRDGLDRIGGTLYRATAAAGTRVEGNPTTGSLGDLRDRSLERSTVDIANQFTDLIVYQRGYQASSQTLGIANNMLRDTLSLLR